MSEIKSETSPESTPESTSMAGSPAKVLGRNEPCPCGSGKKYKRCCGVAAAPKLTPPKAAATQSPGFDPAAFSNMDPQMMSQISQGLQRLPKGQLQRLQAIMQKAMNGKDVSSEAQELERSLPKDFQEMIQGLTATYGASMFQGMQQPEGGAEGPLALPEPSAQGQSPGLTEEQARELVAKAAAEGKISQEQAESLLNVPSSTSLEGAPVTPSSIELPENSGDPDSKFSRLWRNISGKPGRPG